MTILFLLNFFLKFAMNQVLSQVRNLSLVVHFMILQLNYAAIASLFFSFVIEFVNFEIFPVE